MTYSKESLDRIQKIEDLKSAWVIVYANNFRGKEDIEDIRKNKEKIKELEELTNSWIKWEFKTAWRIISSRSMWKLVFGKLRDNTGDIQVCFMKWKVVFNTWREIVESIEIAGEEKKAHKIAEKFCQVWDYVWVVWDLFLTKHWELTILVREFQILSKAIRPLPEKFHGIQDQETIYRQRYLDLIMNEDSYDRFKLRSDFIRTLRNFYVENGFVEIETPILWSAASWAAAKPFITYHNDFDSDYFLRIAPETALKKATVWRFEKVFEMWKNFRNEGSDPSHMQEFSFVEHYAAWWNFEDNMKFTEEMFDYIFEKLKLDRTIKIKDKNGIEKTVNFTTPWERIDYIAGVKRESGIDIESYSTWDEERLRKDIKEAWYTWEWIENQWLTTMIDYLYKKVLRPWIVGPAFVYNYPKTMQPLARASDRDENIVEQFQLLLNGWEVLKAYSELVDPKVQQENFDAQAGALEAWDEEATSPDDDFVKTMEYGMPCQSGFGMWLDRIISLLTGQDNLRDVVLFPLMKDDTNESKKQTNLAVAIINKEMWLEPWQELNTIAHLSAAYWAREWKSLFRFDKVKTKDGVDINMNTTHSIVIKEADKQDKMVKAINFAREKWLLVTEFTREMLETSNDDKVSELTGNKNYSDIDYFGVLIYWRKSDVENLTEGFDLYTWGSQKKTVSEKLNDFKDIPERNKILEIVDKYSTSTKEHLLQVWGVMEYFAEKLWEDNHYWWTVWVLHDIDWDVVDKESAKHCKDVLIKICNESEIPCSVIKDIQSHAGVEKADTLVRKYLSSVDELTWFMRAYFRMLPSENPADIKPKSIKKKIKDKWFASWVDREEVMNCETMLGISLEEFIVDISKALSKIYVK